MITRRQFLKLAGAAAVVPRGCIPLGTRPSGALLNDVHSWINLTLVYDVIEVRSMGDELRVIACAKREGCAVSVAGGRHRQPFQFQYPQGVRRRTGADLARIFHDDFYCNRRDAAATSRHAALRHAGGRARPARPHRTVSSTPRPRGAPRARLAGVSSVSSRTLL